MRKYAIFLLAAFFVVIAGAMVLYADSSPSVGEPCFTELSSNNMILRYGFYGASVFDKSTNNWEFLPMTTITRKKTAGHVNQVNDNFALAAGLNNLAVYDYSLHQWMRYESGGCDDSTDELDENFQITDTYVKVKLLNGPFVTYTTQLGWK